MLFYTGININRTKFTSTLFIFLQRGQIFQIRKIDASVNPPLYYLKDLMNDNLDGAYYIEQLKLSPDPTESDYWQIEKVLKTKTVKKEKWYYVKFLFYPGKLYYLFNIFRRKLEFKNTLPC